LASVVTLARGKGPSPPSFFGQEGGGSCSQGTISIIPAPLIINLSKRTMEHSRKRQKKKIDRIFIYPSVFEG
jgi:hypothetical protein